MHVATKKAPLRRGFLFLRVDHQIGGFGGANTRPFPRRGQAAWRVAA